MGWMRWASGGFFMLVGFFLIFQLVAVWEGMLPEDAIIIVVPGLAFLVVGLVVLCRLDQYAHKWFIRPPDCGTRVRQLLKKVATDDRFHRSAGLQAAGMSFAFTNKLNESEICYSRFYQGGYAGRRDTPERPIVLALSPLCLGRAAAAHELMPMSRDVLGYMALDADLTLSEVLLEECRVWQLPVRYRPVWGLFELFLELIALLGLPSLALYRAYIALTVGDVAW